MMSAELSHLFVTPRSEIRHESRAPLSLAWHSGSPLPRRPVRVPPRHRVQSADPAAWILTGPPNEPFDFSRCVERLCRDIALKCPPLEHIDTSRVLIGMTQARRAGALGLQARVTPLRFHGGRLTRRRRGYTYQVQRFFVDNREMLYLMTFCLPRFLDQSFDDKFVTLFHEMYHIGPAFDGDLRRHNGRYCLHSHSQRLYDRHMAGLARDYLANKPDPDLHAFLRLDFHQLQRRHGSVVGVVVPRPKLIPVVEG